MQEIENAVKNAVKYELVNQLSKNKMLKVSAATAMEVLNNPNIKINIPNANNLTLEEIKTFKKNVQLLMNPKTVESEKRLIATSMTQMQRILKKVQADVNEMDFSIFYAYYIGGQTVRNLSMQHGIDERTVRRARERVLNKITILLHPEIIVTEMFD